MRHSFCVRISVSCSLPIIRINYEQRSVHEAWALPWFSAAYTKLAGFQNACKRPKKRSAPAAIFQFFGADDNTSRREAGANPR